MYECRVCSRQYKSRPEGGDCEGCRNYECVEFVDHDDRLDDEDGEEATRIRGRNRHDFMTDLDSGIY